MRDKRPYRNRPQARTQFAATAHGIPVLSTEHLAAVPSLGLTEALLLAGVQVTECEAGERDALARRLDPHTIQVIAGGVVRAWLAAGTGSDAWEGRRTWPRSGQ